MRVAVQPLEPYEEFWDAIEDVFEERREKIEDRVEREIQPKVDHKVSEFSLLFEEIRTKSRVD